MSRRIRQVLMLALIVPPSSSALADHWANIHSSCQGSTLKVSAHLRDIHGSWEDACARKSGRGVGFGITRRADKCVNNNGMWGEWYLANHASCRADRGTSWSNVHETCTGSRTSRVSAKLEGIKGSWEAACAIREADGRLLEFGVSGVAGKCVKNNGMWGEWTRENVAHCGPRFEEPTKAGCFGPDKQVYSGRLIGDLDGQSWEEACPVTDGPGNYGKPDRCVKNNGMWGEWYTDEPCQEKLEWGSLRDNGCVKDMETPDANAGAISLDGMRSYSAVLWNVGGDWLEACRFARIDGSTPGGVRIASDFPTACVVADADEALSWVSTAVLGAGTAFVAPSAAAGAVVAGASGAGAALVSKGVEKLIWDNVDTGLNVWGVFWVADATCGEIDDQSSLFMSSSSGRSRGKRRSIAASRSRRGALAACPSDAQRLTGPTRCSCSADQADSGRVWGTDTYTSDSSICKAALHAGAIPASGGVVDVALLPGLSGYEGSRRNGVTTSDWGAWKSSFKVD